MQNRIQHRIILYYLWVIHMILQYRTALATKCPAKDVVSALAIYSNNVDQSSLTNTNEIKDYIFNHKAHSHEPRQMFFHILYDKTNAVIGFAEFAYLPNNQVLVLDYLCTMPRNHMLFYTFYHMVFDEIVEALKRKGLYIRFITTELSTSMQQDGQLNDWDSNYFRHLLANEGFILLKYPYYQPALYQGEKPKAFNLAIKVNTNENSRIWNIEKEQVFSIVEELYRSHYLSWYKNYLTGTYYDEHIEELLKRIKTETPSRVESESIMLVRCQLFDTGKCPEYNAENITLKTERRKKWNVIFSVGIWGILAISTCLLCICVQNIASIVASILSIVAGLIAVFSFRREIFHSKK